MANVNNYLSKMDEALRVARDKVDEGLEAQSLMVAIAQVYATAALAAAQPSTFLGPHKGVPS